MSEQKTHAEIIAEMRFHGQQNIDAEKDKPEYGILTMEGRITQNYADRLEAAHKRELSKIRPKTVGDFGQLGNAAKLREAVLALKELDFIEKHAPRALCHYAHAKEKHPYFCDMITSRSETEADTDLKMCRSLLVVEKSLDETEAVNLVDCELCEAMQAYAHGDVAHAVEECYDAIAVLLRTIDVLEGRQKLGKPETKGETECESTSAAR